MNFEPVPVRVTDLQNRAAILLSAGSGFIPQQRGAMIQAIKDFGNRDLKTIRNQSHAVGRSNCFARPDVGTNMVVITASGEEQRPRVCALRDG